MEIETKLFQSKSNTHGQLNWPPKSNVINQATLTEQRINAQKSEVRSQNTKQTDTLSGSGSGSEKFYDGHR